MQPHAALHLTVLVANLRLALSQLCWCNVNNGPYTCTGIQNPIMPPPAAGTCLNHHGCTFSLSPPSGRGSELFCSGVDQREFSEYSVLNGALHSVQHVCKGHLCMPEFVLSVVACRWRMAPADHLTASTLQCNCNIKSDACIQGVCHFHGARMGAGFMPACRYWMQIDWLQPIIDCWFITGGYDRHVYYDAGSTYVLCRDSNQCNNEITILEMTTSSNHCPHQNVDHIGFEQFGTETHLSGPPKSLPNGTPIRYKVHSMNMGPESAEYLLLAADQMTHVYTPLPTITPDLQEEKLLTTTPMSSTISQSSSTSTQSSTKVPSTSTTSTIFSSTRTTSFMSTSRSQTQVPNVATSKNDASQISVNRSPQRRTEVFKFKNNGTLRLRDNYLLLWFCLCWCRIFRWYFIV